MSKLISIVCKYNYIANYCFKNKLNLRTKSEPVTTGLEATVYVQMYIRCPAFVYVHTVQYIEILRF